MRHTTGCVGAQCWDAGVCTRATCTLHHLGRHTKAQRPSWVSCDLHQHQAKRMAQGARGVGLPWGAAPAGPWLRGSRASATAGLLRTC